MFKKAKTTLLLFCDPNVQLTVVTYVLYIGCHSHTVQLSSEEKSRK